MVKNNNLMRGGDSYIAPSVEIAEFSVEQGFAVSPESWGESGAAGQSGSYNEYDGAEL